MEVKQKEALINCELKKKALQIRYFDFPLFYTWHLGQQETGAGFAFDKKKDGTTQESSKDELNEFAELIRSNGAH